MSNNGSFVKPQTDDLANCGGVASSVKPETRMGITVEEVLQIALDALVNTEVVIIQEDRTQVIESNGLKITKDSIGFITVETSKWSFNNRQEFTWKLSDSGAVSFLSESIEVFLKRVQNMSVDIEKIKFTCTGMIPATATA